MKLLKSALVFVTLASTSYAYGQNTVVVSNKLSEGGGCSNWAMEGKRLKHKDVIINFNDDLDVCTRLTNDIHKFLASRTGWSSDKDSFFTLAFAAGKTSTECLNRIDENNYSISYGTSGGEGGEVEIDAKGKGIDHRNVSYVCAQLFVEN